MAGRVRDDGFGGDGNWCHDCVRSRKLSKQSCVLAVDTSNE